MGPKFPMEAPMDKPRSFELLDELPCRDELKPKFAMEEPMEEPPIIWVDGPEPKFDIEGVIRRCC